MDISVIIPAAGQASRMGLGCNKVLMPLAGRPVLSWSLSVFENEPAVKEVIIAARPGELADICALSKIFTKVSRVVEGGCSRALSVKNALAAVSEDTDAIAVHDGARPLLTDADLRLLIAEAEAHPEAGVILAAPVTDSIRLKGGEGLIGGIADREQLVAAQTPQLFPAAVFRRAFAAEEASSATDEAQLAAALGYPVRYVFARDANFKLTCADDMTAAEAILRRRHGTAGEELRYGLGWDRHRLASGRRLVLGGVEIPFDRGFVAHSDGDVLLHAVIDAMLGAASLPDIGRQFPDTDPAYKDISSLTLLERTAKMVRQAGWLLNNIDAVVIAEQPRLAPYIDRIRESIAAVLGMTADAVSVKAKTAEKLGDIGSGAAMAAWALVSVTRK